MNYELIIEDLKTWSKSELFYRDYYQTYADETAAEELFRREDVYDMDKQIVLRPECIGPDIPENYFFTDSQNVIIIQHPRYLPFFMHCHAFFEIIYVLSGHCQEITNDLTVELHEGNLCLLAPNISHGLKVFDDSIILNILIRHSTFMNIFLNSLRDKSQISLFFAGNIYEQNKVRYLIYKTSGDEVIRNYILDMYMEQIHQDKYSDQIICALLTIFFTQLTRRHGKKVMLSEQIGCKAKYSDEIIKYIMSHYESVTLNSLAKHFHFSLPYCSKIVKAISGKPFSELITQIRLGQAAILLSHTDMSIANISDTVGYKNPESFMRAFQRSYCISPGKYRKEADQKMVIPRAR